MQEPSYCLQCGVELSMITWVNHDMFIHSATTKDFDVVLKPGASGAVVLLQPGTINYICRYHPGMKGQIVIKPR